MQYKRTTTTLTYSSANIIKSYQNAAMIHDIADYFAETCSIFTKYDEHG